MSNEDTRCWCGGCADCRAEQARVASPAPTPTTAAAVDSGTYGELPDTIRPLAGLEWDNLTRDEQRQWLIAALDISEQVKASLAHENASLRDVLKHTQDERLILAKLCADEPQFFNPLEAYAAKKIRDLVLSRAALAATQETRSHA